MNPTALLVLALAALVLYLGLSGRLDTVWKAATTGGQQSKGKPQ